MVASSVHYAHDVLLDEWIDVDLSDGPLQTMDRRRLRNLLQVVDGVRLLLAVHDEDLVRVRGLAEVHTQEEPVELRLREGEGALVLYGVLGGHHHEWLWHDVGDAIDRDLMLLHRLQQG